MKTTGWKVRYVPDTHCSLHSSTTVSSEYKSLLRTLPLQCRPGCIRSCLLYKTITLSSSGESCGESQCQHCGDICHWSLQSDFDITCRRLMHIKQGWCCKVLCLLGCLFFGRSQTTFTGNTTCHSLVHYHMPVLCIIFRQNNYRVVLWGCFCYAKPCRDLPLLLCKSCPFKLPALCIPQVISSTSQPV